jgi:TolB-like protein
MKEQAKKMQKQGVVGISGLVLVWVLLTTPAWPGQVVTKELKLWASSVLKEEKTLEAVKARNTAAVLYFQNRSGKASLDPLQKGMSLMLTTDLSKVKGIQVVERVRLQALSEELRLGVSGLVDPSNSLRIGKLLGAQWLIGGRILEGKADRLGIESSPLDVPNQNILGQPAVEGSLSDLFRMEKDLLFGIVKLLRIELKPEEDAEIRRYCSTNPNALLALFRGIAMSDQRNYEKAAEFYELALKEDPYTCVAGEALQELQALGLVSSKRRSQNMLRSLRDRTSITDQLTPEDSTKRMRTPKDVTPPLQRD